MAWRHHRRIAQGACDQAAARQVNQHGLALPAHIDVSVVDGWSATASAVPSGATEIELFPNLAPAAGWADAAPSG
jgi:hypothetical protein